MPNPLAITDLQQVINLGHSPYVWEYGPLSELTDGFEPHDTIYSWVRALHADQHGEPARVGSRGVPGVVGWWVGLEGCYTGTQSPPVPVPIISHILSLKAYPRPNEGNSEYNDEVS